MFYYKTEKDGKVERLFTSNYPEYSGTEITKEEYKNLISVKHLISEESVLEEEGEV